MLLINKLRLGQLFICRVSWQIGENYYEPIFNIDGFKVILANIFIENKDV